MVSTPFPSSQQPSTYIQPAPDRNVLRDLKLPSTDLVSSKKPVPHVPILYTFCRSSDCSCPRLSGCWQVKGIMRERPCILLLIHTSNLSSCRWNHSFPIGDKRLLSPLAPLPPEASLSETLPRMGWGRSFLCQPYPCIFPRITESMREALRALAVVSINRAHQYKEIPSRTALLPWPHHPSVFTLHWRGTTATLNQKGNHSIPTEISTFLPELLVLIFPNFCLLQAADTHTFLCNPIAHWSSERLVHI